MYRNDINRAPVHMVVDQMINDNPKIKYDVRLCIIDLMYLKCYNDDTVYDLINTYCYEALRSYDVEHDKSFFKRVFMDACLSAILQSDKESTVKEVTELIIDLLADAYSKADIPLMFEDGIVDALLLFIGTLINNIEYSFNKHLNDFDMGNCKRLGDNSDIELIDKFYTVCDFTNGFHNNTGAKYSVAIKVYTKDLSNG